MTMYLCNAFSFNMISTPSAEIKMTELTSVEAFEWLVAPSESWGWVGHRTIDDRIVQVVGHADTARLFSEVLDMQGILPSRATVSLKPGDAVILGQYSGPRLSEGATSLPEGASIRWMLVTLVA